ncbi:penicillin-binding transpeptidase domain-containing protein [Oceanobacillus halophilus]|uniref:serine-type D-Ala-D-Ala carboxypeptidase n=1 Tax=Oceanobacillus halophilus TaxID=930130 RepID=A0A495A6Y3_9BACI|nr:penicillin-binding transpeptidase domain-containing protein [Oceanobacillus halophilus]RKQ35592.1 penicillin-binding transpeptidase domain-containing protein [Oceanobacillus halophilus]
MKKVIFFLLILVFLVACSNDKVTPNERFDNFVSNWNNQDFEQLYGMFSSKTKSAFSDEDSIHRKQKIYEDLEVTNLEVSFNPLEDEELEKAMEDGLATIPFNVKMQTFGGPISFDYEATLTQEGEEDDENWYVQWDPGFIFPDLKDGGQIGIRTTEPSRGEILDRNQMPLALNDEVYLVEIVPEKLENPKASVKEIAKLLGVSPESIDDKLTADWVQPDWAVPITKIVDEEVQNKLLNIAGIQIRTITGRIYPAGEAAAHVVGYLRNVRADDFEDFDESMYSADDVIGARGLERLYEEQLKGEPGVEIYITKEDDEKITLTEKEVQNGENIVLTIDINIQEKIYDAYEADAGTTAAINPKTGETLALVSSPSFDPNEIMYGTTEDLWNTLENDEKQPLINRNISTFSPGSAIKPVTAAIGLQNGTIDPDEGLEINGLEWGLDSWGGYKVTRVSSSNGPVDLNDALTRSDNIYFAMQAVDIGAKEFVSGLEQFGFGDDLPYEYPVTASSISNSGNLEDEVLLANTSYGQGELQMSAIHLATTYTTFLNDGNMIKPTFFVNEDKSQVWQEGLITPDQAQVIQDSLRSVVTDGTAKAANIDDFAISGKTGTVELKKSLDEQGAENSWFVAYPTDSQDILVAMMIENTHKDSAGNKVEKVTNILKDVKN